MNRITVNFQPCTPAPAKGYKIYYRLVGAGGPLNYLGNYYSSPVVFRDDSGYPSDYEGIIVAELNGDLCPAVNWSTAGGGGGGGGSGSGSGGIGIGYPIEVRLGTDVAACCSGDISTVYVESAMPTIEYGVFVFWDAQLTSRVTGYLYIADAGVGVIHLLGITNGKVLAPEGTAC